MRLHYLAIASIAASLGAPLAAQAQVGVTTGVGTSVVVDEDGGIIETQRPAFREYVVRERVPSYSWGERVVVGATLPEAGVTYYDVPQQYGPSRYRYTVVNERPVIVEPRTRRVIQVLD